MIAQTWKSPGPGTISAPSKELQLEKHGAPKTTQTAGQS